MTEKDDEKYRNNNICRFCEKDVESDKVGDHCHLTGKYRALLIVNLILLLLNIKVILYQLFFTILVNMIVICSLKS